MLPKMKESNNKLIFEIDTKKLHPSKTRLIKSLITELSLTMTTYEENEFFGRSAEFMRLCASAIQMSNFSESQKYSSEIPFSQQALEYSIDVLHEHMADEKIVQYDN